MNPLEAIRSWPAQHAAAAVLGPSGVIATEGDQTSVFALASLTKPLTALATLVAVEEEALALEQSLGDVALAAELPGATVRHLLAHASGIAPDRRQRAATPGTRRIYSNVGFDVVGEEVSAATGMPFASYLHEAVFAPLGMRTAELRPGLDGQGSPAKDVHASVTDFVCVLSELLAPSGLLHPSSVEQATTVQFPGLRGVLPSFGSQQHNDWGLGFEIRAHKHPHWTSERNSPSTYGHFGQAGTMFWVDPQAQLGLVALSDRPFDEWAILGWPSLSDAVLDAYA